MSWLTTPTARLAAILALCAASIPFSKLAPVAGFLLLVVWVSMPRLEAVQRRRVLAGLLAATLLVTAGFFRFVLHEAIPGIVAGGQAAATTRAIAFMRTIVAAQDHARTHAAIDPDGDGIGSAVGLSALAGLSPLRGGARFERPPLALNPEQLEHSAAGEIVKQGAHYFKLCLPVLGGGFASNPDPAAVDDEVAERRYLLYAWPHTESVGAPIENVFVDEHERVLLLGLDAEGRAPYQGSREGPPCSAALDGGWATWKEKQPRASLPGDRTP